MKIETPGDPYGRSRVSLFALAVGALLVVILLDGLAGTDDHSGALRRAAVPLSTFAGWLAAFYVVWWLRPASSATTVTGGREIRAPAWRRVLFFAVLSAPGWGFAVAWVFSTRRDFIVAAIVWVAFAGLMAWAVTGDRLTLTQDGIERSRWVPRRSMKWGQVRRMDADSGHAERPFRPMPITRTGKAITRGVTPLGRSTSPASGRGSSPPSSS